MIDLTPLDVRKKRGDFRRILRGYEPEEVDTFLQLVAERMEELVKENLAHSEKITRLQEQVGSLEGRERAVQDALVTAERLRSDVKEQAGREAEVVRREAEAEARRIVEDAERAVGEYRSQLAMLERERRQFLAAFRALLERQMERLETEEGSVLAGEGGGFGGGESPSRRRPLAVGGRASSKVPESSPAKGSPESEPSPGFADPTPPVHGPAEAGSVGGELGSRGGSQEVPEEGRGAGDRPRGEDLSSWLAGFLEDEPPGR